MVEMVYRRPSIPGRVSSSPSKRTSYTKPKRTTTSSYRPYTPPKAWTPPKRVVPKPAPKPRPVIARPAPPPPRPADAPRPAPRPVEPSRNPDPASASINPPDPLAESIRQAGQLRNDQPAEVQSQATAVAPAAPQTVLPRPDAPLPVAAPVAGARPAVSQTAGRDLGLAQYEPTAPAPTQDVSGYVPSPGFDADEALLRGAQDEAAFIVENQPGLERPAGTLSVDAQLQEQMVRAQERVNAVRRDAAVRANIEKRNRMFSQGPNSERFRERFDDPNSAAYQYSTVRQATPAVTNTASMRPGFEFMPWQDLESVRVSNNRTAYQPLTAAQAASRERYQALAAAMQNYQRPTYQAQDRAEQVAVNTARPGFQFIPGSDLASSGSPSSMQISTDPVQAALEELAFIQQNQSGLRRPAGTASPVSYAETLLPQEQPAPPVDMSGYRPPPGYQRAEAQFGLGSDELALQQEWMPSTPAGTASTLDYVASRTPQVGARPQAIPGLPVAPPSVNRQYEAPTGTVREQVLIGDRNPMMPPRNPGEFEQPAATEAPQTGNPNPPGWREDGYEFAQLEPPAEGGGETPVDPFTGLDEEQLNALLALIDSEAALREAELNRTGSEAEGNLEAFNAQLSAAEREQLRRAENLAAERGLTRSGIFAGAIGDVNADLNMTRVQAADDTALTMDDVQRALNLLSSEVESKKAFAREENARGGLQLREGERVADLLTRLPLDPTAPPGVAVPSAPILTTAQIPQFPTLGSLTGSGSTLPPIDHLIRRYAQGSSRRGNSVR